MTGSNDSAERHGFSRRRFLHSVVAGAAVGAVRPWPAWPSSSSGPPSWTKPTPDEAIKELAAGNQRFVADRLTACSHGLARLRENTAEKQEPIAAVLACADSRVPVELIFDQSIGRVFVTRVAGNIATPEIIASLEYAVAALGVSALVVLGHRNCGAVKAALKSETVPGQISSLYAYLRPAVEQGAGNVNTAVDANARVQADVLRSSSTVIREATSKGSLKVICGVYDLATGKVTLS